MGLGQGLGLVEFGQWILGGNRACFVLVFVSLQVFLEYLVNKLKDDQMEDSKATRFSSKFASKLFIINCFLVTGLDNQK